MSRRIKGDPENQLLLLPDLERIRPLGKISSYPPAADAQVIPPSRPPPEPAPYSPQESERLVSIRKGDAHFLYYNRSSNLPPPSPVKEALRKALMKVATKAAKSAMAGGTAVSIMTSPMGEDPRSCYPAEPDRQLQLILPGPFITEVHVEPQ
jgi:hypothetical protein